MATCAIGQLNKTMQLQLSSHSPATTHCVALAQIGFDVRQDSDALYHQFEVHTACTGRTHHSACARWTPPNVLPSADSDVESRTCFIQSVDGPFRTLSTATCPCLRCKVRLQGVYDLQLAEVSVRRTLGHWVRFVSGFGKVRILTAVQSRHHFQRKQQPRYLHAHHTGPACWVAVASHAPYFLHLSFMWWLRRDYRSVCLAGAGRLLPNSRAQRHHSQADSKCAVPR